MAESIGKLEEQALKRKDRLRQLRNKHVSNDVQQPTNISGDADGTKSAIPRPIFRNYKPGNEEQEVYVEHGYVENEVQMQLEMMKTPITIEEIDIANLAPRKPDWDLKRDVSKKLEKLERRTQKAIAELIRERLKAGQEQDLLQAVNIGTRTENDPRGVSTNQ